LVHVGGGGGGGGGDDDDDDDEEEGKSDKRFQMERCSKRHK